MQLYELEINGYRNLKTEKIEFKKPLVILAGNNGSGKSNLLEAISGIFRNELTAKNCLPGCAYDLRYALEHNEEHTFGSNQENALELTYNGKKRQRRRGGDRAVKTDMEWPEIIAVYSGEETRLQQLFSAPSVASTFRYLNRDYWSAALLTLLLQMWRTQKNSTAQGNPSTQGNASDKLILSRALGRSADISKAEIEIQADRTRLENAIKPGDEFSTFLSRIFLGEAKFSFSGDLETLYNQLGGKSAFVSGNEMLLQEGGDTRFQESKTLFDCFSKASVGKKAVFSDISIRIPAQNDGKIELSLLSEGEKR